MPTRNVDLIDELDRFVRAKVDSGRYEGNHLQYFSHLAREASLVEVRIYGSFAFSRGKEY